MLRGHSPGCFVFAFEGDQDKAVYFQWIRRIRPDLVYEPFPCDGKKQVFLFREMLDRDLGDLSSRVYFFIDRDFDDFAGYPERENTFMTEHYSVENYLVSADVLEELLKDEFHCHAEPKLRAELMALFEARFSDFLQVTKELNKRLFIARRMKYRLEKNLPDGINQLATVHPKQVAPTASSPEAIVIFGEVPSKEEEEQLTEEFSKLDPATRYRGKFNLLFFMKWLDLLCSERRDAASELFASLERPRAVNIQSISLGMLASKAGLPRGLSEFIAAVQ
ncbi:hypothetical protein XH94_34920 [Bradyrhizobium zhanjiangense]|uniref:DUF4435 domain-containing protein n=2 Tax=Bradyrhizobium zhanjiangense TaxID=1325107 RepID=A0A4Q0S597_9BRAD|nr:hypothetical protein XH94_34920 [Bradyrhizobium zhanjiangense]